MKYHKEIMNQITKKYNETNDEFNQKMANAIKTSSNIFSKKIISFCASFSISYVLNLILLPLFVITGLYNIALVRPLTILASIISATIITKNRYNDSNMEKFKEYMDSEIHVKKLEEEIETEIAVANVKSKQAVLLNMASKVATEQDVLATLEEDYNITSRDNDKLKETIKEISSLEEEKKKYEEKLNTAIKQNVLLTRFQKLLNNKSNSQIIKYLSWGLFLGMMIWNIPQSIANIFVPSYSIDLISALLSAFLPPLAFSLTCATLYNKHEKEEKYLYNKMSKELIDNSLSKELSVDRLQYEKSFDEIINRLVDINLELADDKIHIEKKSIHPTTEIYSNEHVIVEEKPMTLKYIKKN